MKKSLRLSIIASLLMGSDMVLAASASGGKMLTLSATRTYTVVADSSLYQLALQSGISVSKLRKLNNGSLDRRDAMKTGESLLLPAHSPLFPADDTRDVIASDLPELGMGNAPLPKGGTNPTEMKTAGTAQTLGVQNWNTMTGDQVKSQAESWARNQAKGQVVAPLQKGAQDFLGQFGRAQVNIAVDDKGSLKGSGSSLFSPWYQTDSMVAFSQVGIHGQDNRVIGNVGAGVRFDRGDWLWGYNAFIDQDISRTHTRGGMGAELWRDNLKLAANYYHPLSGWKDSKDFDDYLERPAKGFDVRTQGYLPSYPQLGASVVYEQYFGDEVALFGKDNLQQDPHAVTVGVDYTPVSLLTFKLSHKAGQNGKNEQKADLQLSYQIGTPLDRQLDPDRVAQARSLKGSRYDLVDRNYDIVLEYKEKNGVFDLDLAAVPANLLEGDAYVMQPLVQSKHRITTVNWNGDIILLAMAATAGTDNPQGWAITLPAWDSTPDATNLYYLSITLTDEKGRQMTSNTVEVAVGQQRQGNLVVENGANKPATGLDTDVVQLVSYLTNHQGDAITDPVLIPKWVVKDAVTGKTLSVSDSCTSEASGAVQPCLSLKSERTEQRNDVTYYVRELVSTLPGRFLVATDLGSYGVTAPQEITFSVSDAVSEVTGKLEVDGDNRQPASGLDADAVTLSAHLEDQTGTLINDAALTPVWVAKSVYTDEAVPLVTGERCPTDAQGDSVACLRVVKSEVQVRNGISYYVNKLVSNQPGAFIITADLGAHGVTNEKTITFTSAEPMLDIVRAEIQDPNGTDILSAQTSPQVGVAYTVKLFDAANEDVTDSVPPDTLRWVLDGNAKAAGAQCDVTLTDHDTGVTGTTFVPRPNGRSNSGVVCGDQGFGLKVLY